MADVHYEVKSIVTELPDGRRYLLVKMILRCPVCGEIEMDLPGHHLRRVVELLQDQLLQHLDLASHDRAKSDIADLTEMNRLIATDPATEIKH